MVASEAVPFAKTGGLADVLGALPAALKAQGEDVAVVIPHYLGVHRPETRRVWERLPVAIGSNVFGVSVCLQHEGGVPYYSIDSPLLFQRAGLYTENGRDYPDNAQRFAVFCQAALGVVRHLFRPDILHCHDWQAALAAPYVRRWLAGDPTYFGIRHVFTIHNLGYQGLFPREVMPDLKLDPALYRPDYLEFYGQLNLMKAALIDADWITTVSRGYAREIQTDAYGFGLQGILRARADRLTGILNGVDYGQWSPETDPHLAAPYSSADLTGKRRCKRDLLETFGLPIGNLDRPVIGVVSRLATQKGWPLVQAVLPALLAERDDFLLTLIGTGEPQYEQFFRDLAAAYPDRVAVRITYSDELSHKIEAGADLFLMPSEYEPCGLNQIYSLRYGTVPVVRATGGLDDTIETGTGFKFRDYSAPALRDALLAALSAYANRERWQAMMRRGMEKDFSWDASAREYRALYDRLLA